MILPYTFYMGKNFFRRTLMITVSLMILSIAVFWWGSGKLFTENYYYPQAVIAGPLLFIIAAVWLILDALEYVKKKPYATLSDNGIQLYNGVYKEIGLLPWREIIDFREMAASNSRTGRKIYFYARYPEHFIQNINSDKKKKQFQKIIAANGGSILVIETNRFDLDVTDLKHTITTLINHVK